MLRIGQSLRLFTTDVTAVLLCSCPTGLLLQQPQQQLSSNGQNLLWPTGQYSTQAKKPRKRLHSASAAGASAQQQQQQQREQQQQPDPSKLAAKLSAAAPVQPTHRILKVVLQSQAPLTQPQLYEQVRAEFGAEAFPSRRTFKNYLHQVQKAKWVQAKPPQLTAVSSNNATKAGKKAAVKATDPFVYVGTQIGMRVDLNEPGSLLQQKARAAADKWTKTNLAMYEELMQTGKVPVTVDNFAMVPREQRRLLFKQLSPP